MTQVRAQPPSVQFKVLDKPPLLAAGGNALAVDSLLAAVGRVNGRLATLGARTEALALNIFEVLDFRMLSGMMGELVAVDLARSNSGYAKNPNLDGYPDLVPVSTEAQRRDFAAWKATDMGRFIDYPYGGFEIKNTFGTKRSGAQLAPGMARSGNINGKLDWKAHHQNTNNLIGLLSDYVGGAPQVVAAMFANDLVEGDWTEKQNPGSDSTMTSFSVIGKTGWAKMRRGLRFCIDSEPHLQLLGAPT